MAKESSRALEWFRNWVRQDHFLQEQDRAEWTRFDSGDDFGLEDDLLPSAEVPRLVTDDPDGHLSGIVDVGVECNVRTVDILLGSWVFLLITSHILAHIAQIDTRVVMYVWWIGLLTGLKSSRGSWKMAVKCC